MSVQRTPTTWLLTPLLAFAGTLVGVLVLFYGQSALIPALAGGLSELCDAPSCALVIDLMLIAGGFFTLCASAIAATVVGVLHREQPRPRAAVGRGVFVASWCVLAYLVVSVVVWIVV